MSTPTPVPLVDLKIQHRRIREAAFEAMHEVADNTAFVLSPHVAAFEREFAQYCEVDRVVGVANGTDAIEIALRAAGVGPGDEVIIPANTFIATAEAVVRAGATLALTDCDDDFLMDPGALAARVTGRTRAVIPVHLYGQTAAVEAVRAVVGPEVILVEDAAQAQGALRFGARAGSLGDVAATSFYPGKNLGAYGDGGALMTSSDAIADAALALRNHGGVRKYEHLVVGMNSRLDGLQAVVLSLKLRLLDEWNKERRQAADLYEDLLGGLPDVVTPRTVDGNTHVWHLYVVRVPDRDRVLTELNAAGIGAGIHYPAPVHLLPAFAGLGLGRGAFPVAEKLADEILSLPIYPGITAEQQHRVVDELTRALS
jgi:dTDP-4-amino-4,6-dideoxygalactose transaminase